MTLFFSLSGILPGTKLRIKGKLEVRNNMILLTADNFEVLGGRVDRLVSEWKAEKLQRRFKGVTGAPKFMALTPEDIKAKKVQAFSTASPSFVPKRSTETPKQAADQPKDRQPKHDAPKKTFDHQSRHDTPKKTFDQQSKRDAPKKTFEPKHDGPKKSFDRPSSQSSSTPSSSEKGTKPLIVRPQQKQQQQEQKPDQRQHERRYDHRQDQRQQNDHRQDSKPKSQQPQAQIQIVRKDKQEHKQEQKQEAPHKLQITRKTTAAPQPQQPPKSEKGVVSLKIVRKNQQ